MRCGRAQQLIMMREDEPLSDVDADRLDLHLEQCADCRAERDVAARLSAALGGLRAEAAVPAGLEAATLQRIHDLENETGPAWSTWVQEWLPGPVLAAGAAAAVVAVFVWGDVPRVAPPPMQVTRVIELPHEDVPPVAVATAEAAADAEPRTPPSRPVEVASAVAEEPPMIAPPELASSLHLLLDLEVLEHIEKLEHYEHIETTQTLNAPGEPNG